MSFFRLWKLGSIQTVCGVTCATRDDQPIKDHHFFPYFFIIFILFLVSSFCLYVIFLYTYLIEHIMYNGSLFYLYRRSSLSLLQLLYSLN